MEAAQAVRRDHRRATILYFLLIVPIAVLLFGIAEALVGGWLGFVSGLCAWFGWWALVNGAFRRAGREDAVHWYDLWYAQRGLHRWYGSAKLNAWRHGPWW